MVDFASHFSQALALMQVVLIDLALSGDNAIIIAMAAAGLPENQRARAIGIGIAAAIVLRILFASAAVYLLDLPGLILIGGLMLGWVCVKMWREIRADAAAEDDRPQHASKTLRQSVLQIVVADVSMSLDNVLAVAGAARDHMFVMAFGLVLAIGMMAFAANAITGLLRRWPWLNYAGLALIAFVAVRMVIEGVSSVKPLVAALLPLQ